MRIVFAQKVECGADIVLFASAFVMSAGRQPNAAKVEPESYQTGVKKSGRRAKNDLVVHRSAAERMRMRNESHAAKLLFGFLDDRFESAVRRGYQ
jgi:hypothetical protein